MINAVREKGGVSENTESLFCVLHRKSIFLFTCLIDIQGTDLKNNCNYILSTKYIFIQYKFIVCKVTINSK